MVGLGHIAGVIRETEPLDVAIYGHAAVLVLLVQLQHLLLVHGLESLPVSVEVLLKLLEKILLVEFYPLLMAFFLKKGAHFFQAVIFTQLLALQRRVELLLDNVLLHQDPRREQGAFNFHSMK